MEQCAFISASRVARGGHLLTAGMDGIAFSAPTRVGDIMYIEAQVGGGGVGGGGLTPARPGPAAAWELATGLLGSWGPAACAPPPTHIHTHAHTPPLPPPTHPPTTTTHTHTAPPPPPAPTQVTAIFGSSVEVMISVWGEMPDVGDMFGCGDAYATIVRWGSATLGAATAPCVLHAVAASITACAQPAG